MYIVNYTKIDAYSKDEVEYFLSFKSTLGEV